MVRKSGNYCMVYEDPLTETTPEGMAVLVECMGRYTNQLEKWQVRFVSEPFVMYERNILIESLSTPLWKKEKVNHEN